MSSQQAHAQGHSYTQTYPTQFYTGAYPSTHRPTRTTHNGAHPHKHIHSPTHTCLCQTHPTTPNHTDLPTYQTHLRTCSFCSQVSSDRSTWPDSTPCQLRPLSISSHTLLASAWRGKDGHSVEDSTPPVFLLTRCIYVLTWSSSLGGIPNGVHCLANIQRIALAYPLFIW